MRTSATPVQELRDTILSFIAAMNAQDAERVLEHLTDAALWRQPDGVVAEGKEAIRDVLQELWLSTDDMHIPVDDIDLLVSPDGRTAATFWRATMTMTGYHMGFAPTGRRAAFRGVCLYRMAGPRIAEHTLIYDQLDVSQQLGLLPTPTSRSFRLMAAGHRMARRLQRA